MEVQSKAQSLPPNIASQIEVLSTAAKVNGAHMRVQEILALVSLDLTERELELAWSATPSLNSRLLLRAGIVLDPAEAGLQDWAACDDLRRLRAQRHVREASDFAHFAKLGAALAVGVTGSTAYMSAGECDDIDLFCVTKRDNLWVFLTKTLLLARVFRLLRKRHPKICLSYVADQSYAERQFSAVKDGLFARDALNTLVIRGSGYYRNLLISAVWMSSYFPKLFRSKVEVLRQSEVAIEERKETWRVANLFIFAVVGTYLRMKSFAFNTRLARQGKTRAVFTADLSGDHCVFESNRYAELRRIYEQIERSEVISSG